jgi:cardiolipin synthase A/B
LGPWPASSCTDARSGDELHDAGEELERKIEHRYAVADPQFRREMSVMLGPSILPGNHVTDLQNGEEIFPAMLAAIRGAQKTITFETYIYWSGEIGEEFADALAERARAGVKVHVTIDWAGSVKMDESLLEQMEEAGVEVERYRPLHWYNLGRLNNRTHRKLLVVDGKVGFTGGVGIADSGSAMPRIPTTGARRISASRARWWRSCRRPSTTTGSR